MCINKNTEELDFKNTERKYHTACPVSEIDSYNLRRNTKQSCLDIPVTQKIPMTQF